MKNNKIKKKFEIKMSRRQVLKLGLAGGAGLMLPWKFGLPKAFATALPGIVPLSDPENVDKFLWPVPNAMASGFKYNPVGMGRNMAHYEVGVGRRNDHFWGSTGNGANFLETEIYGYDDGTGPTWPGKTFQVESGRPVQIQWVNNLEPNGGHLLPVDTLLHWCYSLPRYTRYSIAEDGVPTVAHVHGHHSQARSDGNPEEFFTYRWRVTGPRFRGRTSIYDNSQPAGHLWYHDHALGITRLNVYAGMAGFYFVRDLLDTGLLDNPLGLPAGDYEKAYAIQDRMFEASGKLYYPAFPADEAYGEFIEGVLPSPPFPTSGLSALAEFFGDHMVVNGIAWPKEVVEPRRYRLHLLNGCDSRFIVVQFRAVPAGETDLTNAGPPLDFTVIGSDQGLASEPQTTTKLVFEPGSRYDIVFDFGMLDGDLKGKRVIMENIGDDAPFNGELAGDFFDDRQTDRIMAFNVEDTDVDNTEAPDFSDYIFGPEVGPVDRYRNVALFEGTDEFDRLQPLLGTAEPATDFTGRPINWPDTAVYQAAGLTGQMNGASAWHSPTTENPALNTTEEWAIWNATGDAHPIHLHLVHFEIAGRREIIWDTATTDDDRVLVSRRYHCADSKWRRNVPGCPTGHPAQLYDRFGYMGQRIPV